MANRVVHHHNREDGSEIRITVTEMFGLGLHRSVDIYVHRRLPGEEVWSLLNDRPHPDWKNMSLDQYRKYGRSELLRYTTFAERVLASKEL